MGLRCGAENAVDGQRGRCNYLVPSFEFRKERVDDYLQPRSKHQHPADRSDDHDQWRHDDYDAGESLVTFSSAQMH